MKAIRIQYEISIGDFRKATYYALFLRHRRALQIMFLVAAAGIIYGIAAALGIGEANPLVFLLAGAYLLWGILLFAGAEKSVLKYVKTSDNLIGCSYLAEFEKSRMRIRVKERNIDFSCPVHKLACVFELSALFLVYSSVSEVFIIPKRYVSEEDCRELRDCFRLQLKDRFSTRFEKR